MDLVQPGSSGLSTATNVNITQVGGNNVSTTVPVSGTVTATPSGTQDDNLKQVNGATVNVGVGAASTGTQRVAVSSDSFPATQAVSGPLTDTQLRASPVPVSNASLPLPSGASTSTLQTTGNTSLSSIDTKLSGTLTTVTSGSVGTTLDGVHVNQTTSNTSAVQLQAGSIPATNGIIVKALSTNTATVFVGDSGVTTANGYELTAGEPVALTATNINVVYVTGSNGSDKVCWNVL